MTSSSARRNDMPNSPLRNPETLLTESLVLERLAGIRYVLKPCPELDIS